MPGMLVLFAYTCVRGIIRNANAADMTETIAATISAPLDEWVTSHPPIADPIGMPDKSSPIGPAP